MSIVLNLELKYPVVCESGRLVKNLCINGRKTKAEFLCDNKMRELSIEKSTWLFNRLKHCRVNDLPAYTHMAFYDIKELKGTLHYGTLDGVYIIRYRSHCEVGLIPVFDFKDQNTTSVNPLRMIRGMVAEAKSNGFKRTEYLGENRLDDEWYHIYLAYLYYSTPCNNDTIMEKIKQATALLNKLQDKLAAVHYKELSEEIKRNSSAGHTAR